MPQLRRKTVVARVAAQLAVWDRRTKKNIFMLIDGVLAACALYVAYALHENSTYPAYRLANGGALIGFIYLPAMALSLHLGIAETKLKTFDNSTISKIVISASILSLLLMVFSSYFTPLIRPTVFVIFGVIYLSITVLARFMLLRVVKWLYSAGREKKNVLIYGAGNTGLQLAAALEQSRDHNVVAFIDDNKRLQKMVIRSAKVYGSEAIESLIAMHNISVAFIAIPAATPLRQKTIAKKLKDFGLDTLTVPSFADIISGNHLVESLQPVSPLDLLHRDPFENRLPMLKELYEGKSVFISGAGGSIGSELVRQVLQFAPKCLILFERNEYALYNIYEECTQICENRHVKIVPAMGDVLDKTLLRQLFQDHRPDIVLHAAAYKHVPLVEDNIVSGAKNNILGTETLAQTAQEFGAERFILISTDKAVRPTNVMGATKRIAEMLIQARASKHTRTQFSMVRFGNVLGSSGSVIPRFREQIERGGPVTLTHRDVTRYFMTIPEAVQLVLIASTFTEGGDVFLLDMGEPVRIRDLARKMIELSKLTVRDADNPGGDIEICETGLRRGEKLFEELLITQDALDTPHEKIKRAREECLNFEDTKMMLRDFSRAIDIGDKDLLIALFQRYVHGFNYAKLQENSFGSAEIISLESAKPKRVQS